MEHTEVLWWSTFIVLCLLVPVAFAAGVLSTLGKILLTLKVICYKLDRRPDDHCEFCEDDHAASIRSNE